MRPLHRPPPPLVAGPMVPASPLPSPPPRWGPWALGPLLAAGWLAPARADLSPVSWRDIDILRAQLEARGSRVVQRDCGRQGLQGLYHQPSATIVVCRVHRTPAAVWNTLAHEAAHRMQSCAGGTITRPEHRRAMARALAVHAPEEWRSLRLYPRSEQLAELEARYTARLPPAQVQALFRRYCGGPDPSSLSRRSTTAQMR